MMDYEIDITVNGQRYQSKTPAHLTLLQFLRMNLCLTGSKEGCGIGECGACSVILNGKLINACLVLAVEANGATVQTIEGEGASDELSDLQAAFIDHHALQCGFCTPGIIMAARDLLSRNPKPTDDEIIEVIAGNLCRCTGYETVLAAIRSVVDTKAKAGVR